MSDYFELAKEITRAYQEVVVRSGASHIDCVGSDLDALVMLTELEKHYLLKWELALVTRYPDDIMKLEARELATLLKAIRRLSELAKERQGAK